MAALGSPQSLLLCSLNNPNSLNLSSKQRCFSPLIFFSLFWICSNRSTYFFYWGPQNRTQYFRWTLRRTEQRGRITSFDLLDTFS